MMTARDVIAEAICHDEQLEIWADEFFEHLLGSDFIRSPDSYEEKLDLVSCVKTAIKELVEKAFDHPALQADSVRQELASQLLPSPRAQHGALMAAKETWDLVEKLRAPEGHSITLMCDNPDFNGQLNCAIEVCGDWTDWEPKRFTGDTILAALEAALSGKDHPND